MNPNNDKNNNSSSNNNKNINNNNNNNNNNNDRALAPWSVVAQIRIATSLISITLHCSATSSQQHRKQHQQQQKKQINKSNNIKNKYKNKNINNSKTSTDSSIINRSQQKNYVTLKNNNCKTEPCTINNTNNPLTSCWRADDQHQFKAQYIELAQVKE